jgi:ribosomal subunit interface protein
VDLMLKARGARITEHLRQVAEHKLARLERMEPRLTRLQIEIISEKNPRQGGAHRVEAAADTPRRTFRAHADARDVEAALELVAEKLERQIRDHHEKLKARRLPAAGRVKSVRAARPTRGE